MGGNLVFGAVRQDYFSHEFLKILSMKEKFDFIYKSVKEAIESLNSRKIPVEHAKAVASLAKQANNVIATQLDAAKFMANIKESAEHLEAVGLKEAGDEGKNSN